MGLWAKAAQQARKRARQRRLATIDREREQRDHRIEAAAAEVFVSLSARADARAAVQVAEVDVAAGLRRLLEEAVSVDGAAELCELPVSEARRLLRLKKAQEPAVVAG